MVKLYVVSLSDAERLLLQDTIKKGKASARTIAPLPAPASDLQPGGIA